jgi:Ca2+-binding RTX toxin-like protein
MEILDFKEASISYSIFATVSQLSSFASIINSVTRLPQLSFYIAGIGGTIDFSTRIETGSSISVDANYSSAGITIVGTANDDILSGSNHNDTLNGGEGSDVIRDTGGADIRKRRWRQ